MLQAIAVRRAPESPLDGEAPIGRAVLQHDERHLRRRTIELVDGRKVLVDLAEPTVLIAGDALVIAGGGIIEIAAAAEPLYAIYGRNATHVTELVWHIGNRHLAAAIKGDRILILRDHVIKAMLEGLGARVEEIVTEFNPVRGAYSSHGSHEHHHSDHEHHAHTHSDHH